VDIPEVEYARSGDVAIAYQVVGDGERDLVLVPFLANIYSFWRLYGFAEFVHALARGRRLIVVNPRGVGLSDRPRGFTVESRMDDIRAVMDAVGSERAALLGLSESAATCAVFAASYPERVEHLLLWMPYVRHVASEEERERMIAQMRVERELWGDREHLSGVARMLNPQWADVPEYLDSTVWHHRLTASPATIVEFRRMQLDLDISEVLPAVASRRSSCPRSARGRTQPRSQRRYRAPSSSSSPVRASRSGKTTSGSRRSTPSWRASGRGMCRTPCSRRSSSPTSWARRSAPRSWETERGASCSGGT
jgi:pimeloyl-ACP methyl ester carboxylesterase